MNNPETTKPAEAGQFAGAPCSAGYWWVRTRDLPDAPWYVLQVVENENGVLCWEDDGETWPVEPDRADFVGPLHPPN